MARIVINPSTFRNDKDALCVAFNEALRVAMEEMSFEPEAEPTDAQREFFSDTAYADDELQLRCTILARICTFDTSVKDPTDEQLAEAVSFLEDVMQAGFPQNEWEQSCVQRMRDMVSKIAASGVPGEGAEAGGTSGTGAQAADKGGKEDEEKAKAAAGNAQGQKPVDVPERSYAVREQRDYKDGDSWRTATGMLIGNDEQYKQYQQAVDALKGTGAYYDNGVFRDKTGIKIGGNLDAVNAYAGEMKEHGENSYYDGKGVWRDKQTGDVTFRRQQAGQQTTATGTQQQPAQQPAQQDPALAKKLQKTDENGFRVYDDSGKKIKKRFRQSFMENLEKKQAEEASKKPKQPQAPADLPTLNNQITEHQQAISRLEAERQKLLEQ